MNTPTPPPGAGGTPIERAIGGLECGSCRRWALWGHSGRCSYCGDRALAWRPLEGKGTVLSATDVPSRTEPTRTVVLVRMVEGVDLLGLLSADQATDPMALIDASVRAISAGPPIVFVLTYDD